METCNSDGVIRATFACLAFAMQLTSKKTNGVLKATDFGKQVLVHAGAGQWRGVPI